MAKKSPYSTPAREQHGPVKIVQTPIKTMPVPRKK
jgi:hypothetical protein